MFCSSKLRLVLLAVALSAACPSVVCKPVVERLYPNTCTVEGCSSFVLGASFDKEAAVDWEVQFGDVKYSVKPTFENKTALVVQVPHVLNSGEVSVLLRKSSTDETIGKSTFVFSGQNCPGYTEEEQVVCSNKGACDYTTGKCECQSGYNGDACEKANWSPYIPLDPPCADKSWWEDNQYYVTIPVLCFVVVATIAVVAVIYVRRRRSSPRPYLDLDQEEMADPSGQSSPGYHRIG